MLDVSLCRLRKRVWWAVMASQIVIESRPRAQKPKWAMRRMGRTNNSSTHRPHCPWTKLILVRVRRRRPIVRLASRHYAEEASHSPKKCAPIATAVRLRSSDNTVAIRRRRTIHHKTLHSKRIRMFTLTAPKWRAEAPRPQRS